MTTIRPVNGLALVALNDLRPSPANPRKRLEDLDDLAQSIREHGIIQPIIAQRIPGKDGLQIIAGHRRHAAARRAGLTEVPVVIRRDMLPDEELLTMLVENGQRAGLDPIEEARAVRRLIDVGKTEAEVARSVGRHVSWVRNRLMLLRLPIEEQEEVRAGHYTLGHALNIVRGERRRQRERANPVSRPIGRPKGKKTKPYFGDTHPLAKAARARCSCTGKPKIGGVACGECWEAVIREDERHAHDVQAEAS